MRRDRRARDARRFAAIAAAALVLLAAGSASAARLLQVRVGSHPGYARVVLETDAPAAHEIVATSTPGEVTVRIAAANAVRRPPGGGPGAPDVSIADGPDGTTLVSIRALEPVRVETQVLAAPPRLVVDLRPNGEAASDAPPAAEPEPVEPAAEEASAPEPAAVPAAPVRNRDDEEELVMPAIQAPEAMEAPLDEEPPQVAAAPVPPPEPIAPELAPPEPVAPPAEAASEPPAPEPPVEPPVEIAEPTPSVPEPPAVSTAPPVAPRVPTSLIELRTLATALAVVVGLILVASALLRRTAAPAWVGPAAAADSESPPAPERVEPAVSEPIAPALERTERPRPVAAAPSQEEATLQDFVRMQSRVDDRLGLVLERLDEIAARLARLEARGAKQDDELISHRTAIARLQRSLRPVPAPRSAPSREEDATPPRRVL